MQSNKGLRHVGFWLAAAGLPPSGAATPLSAVESANAGQAKPAPAGLATSAANAPLQNFTGGTS